MLETLYAQLITDPNTQEIRVETDKTGATMTHIYRDDYKIVIRHRADDFLSCWIVKRQQAITKQIAKINLIITPIGVTTLLQLTLQIIAQRKGEKRL